MKRIIMLLTVAALMTTALAISGGTAGAALPDESKAGFGTGQAAAFSPVFDDGNEEPLPPIFAEPTE